MTAFPTVTLNSIMDKIKHVQYTVLPGTTTTICLLILENGHSVVGKAACVYPENFNQALGEKFAYEDAIKQCWLLEGYLLQEQRYLVQQKGYENKPASMTDHFGMLAASARPSMTTLATGETS